MPSRRICLASQPRRWTSSSPESRPPPPGGGSQNDAPWRFCLPAPRSCRRCGLRGGPVVELLARLDSHLEDCPALRALARASVETLASTDMPLTPESLARDWDTQLAELGEDSARWIEGERSAKLAYAPATDLWHSLLESWNENGRSSIGEMFGLMEEPAKPSRIARAQRIADFLAREHRPGDRSAPAGPAWKCAHPNRWARPNSPAGKDCGSSGPCRQADGMPRREAVRRGALPAAHCEGGSRRR